MRPETTNLGTDRRRCNKIRGPSPPRGSRAIVGRRGHATGRTERSGLGQGCFTRRTETIWHNYTGGLDLHQIDLIATARQGTEPIWPPKAQNRILGGRWFCFSVRVVQVTRWCSTTSPASWANATHRMPRVWPKSGECSVGVPEMFVRSQSPEAHRSQKKS